jgi:hypothetical protein
MHTQTKLEPLFESNANASIARVTSTFGQRGAEYGDTWRNAQWLAFRAVAKRFNLSIPESALRPLCAAVLVDVKYQRLEGGYKDDSIIDGIAYAANLAEEMRVFESPLKSAKCPNCKCAQPVNANSMQCGACLTIFAL